MGLRVKAYAKINLALDVLFRRPDGYHELSGVMQSVSIFDELRIAPGSRVRVECSAPLPPGNTAARAAELFYRSTGHGASIYLEKHIPSEAGLGGASADAAAVLRGLSLLYGSPLPEHELMRLALCVGADVPFCMMGGCALAQGVGERLTPLPVPQLNMVIAKGRGGVSTAALFSLLRLPLAHSIDVEGLRQAILSGDRAAIPPLCKNALEPPATDLLGEIAAVRDRLLELGAEAAFMTGSGAAVVGLFEDEQAAERAACRMGTPFARACRTMQTSLQFAGEPATEEV